MRSQWTATAVAILTTITIPNLSSAQFSAPGNSPGFSPTISSEEIGTGVNTPPPTSKPAAPPSQPIEPQLLGFEPTPAAKDHQPLNIQPIEQTSDIESEPAEVQPLEPQRLESVRPKVVDSEKGIQRTEIAPIQPSPLKQAPAEFDMETIVERYDDGGVKVQRTVVRDDQDNYLNHGNWKWLDRKGEIISEGEFEFGNREGRWIRWMAPSQAKIFGEVPYKTFEPPFLSEANFARGVMNGEWNIYDSRERKVSQITLKDGIRHGKAVWWHPNGQVMRRIEFNNGVIDGALEVWDATGKQIAREVYRDGQQITMETKETRPGQKAMEVTMLNPRVVIVSPDAWWDAEFAEFKQEGEPLRHGELTQWHPNGMKMRSARFDHDQPVGMSTWWHDNGQKSLEGEFEGGEQDGLWTWWHRNGMKATEGSYRGGAPVGEWIWWDQQGRVIRRSDMSNSPKQLPESGNGPQEVTELESVSPRTTLLPPELNEIK